VPNLKVDAEWRIGRAVIHPEGWLAGELDRLSRLRGFGPADEQTFGQGPRARTDATITVQVTLQGDDHFAEARRVFELAREPARDALGVLALYQHARSNWDSSSELFGLDVDVFGAMTHAWLTTDDGKITSGYGREGAAFRAEFGADDRRRFAEDPRFVYLDAALVADDPTDWQRRAVATCRVLRLALGEPREATRILLSAVALETLLGDRSKEATGRHQLSRRAAFRWCVTDGNDQHGPTRAACPYMLATNAGEIAKFERMAEPGGGRYQCGYYWDVRGLLADRGQVAHGGELTEAAAKRARAHTFTIERVLLRILEWLADSEASRFEELDAAIEALPKPVWHADPKL
jgi:hypothetical protein